MHQQTAFNVSIAPDVPPDERTALVSALRAHATVQEQPTTRAIDPATIAMLVVILGAVKATADAGKSVFDLAQTINSCQLWHCLAPTWPEGRGASVSSADA